MSETNTQAPDAKAAPKTVTAHKPGSPYYQAPTATPQKSRNSVETQVQPDPAGDAKKAEAKPEGSKTEAKSDLILGKFKSQEDLLKAYQELEAKQSGKKPDEPKTTDKTDGKKDEAKTEDSKDVSDLNKFQPFYEEFSKSSSLSEASYTQLKDMGYPKELVDAYLEGQRAINANKLNSVYSLAGGKESFDQMLEWATENLSEEEVEAYDAQVNSKDEKIIKFAVKGLYARYQGKNPASATPIQGSLDSGPAGYRNKEEHLQAMRDPRYAKSSSYRADVEAKLSKSPWMKR